MAKKKKLKQRPRQQLKLKQGQKEKPKQHWRYWSPVIVSLIMLGAFLLRVLPQTSKIFVGSEVWFREVDPWYQMRLVENMIANWPMPMHWDMYAAYPAGSAIGYYPLMHWIIATAGKIGLNYELVGAFLPPIVGMLTLIPVYLLARELFNKRVAILSCLLVAILPSEFLHRSLLGFTDHHVMEAFLMVLTTMFFILAFRRVKGRRWYTIGAGISLGLYLLNWHGVAFFIVIIGIAILAEILWRYKNDQPVAHIAKITAVATLIGTLLASPYLFRAFDNKLTFLASGALIGGSLMMWFLTTKIKKKKVLFTVTGSILFVSLIALEFLTPILLQDPQAHIWRLITPAVWGVGAWIGEAQPLHPSIAFAVFGLSFFLFFVGLYYAIRKNQVSWFFIMWAILLVLSTIGQRRWGYYSIIPISMMTSYLVFFMADRIKSEARIAVVVVMCFFLIVPSTRAIIGVATLPNNIDAGWYDACTWLRENTPEPFESDEYYTLNVAEKPAYGVLSWWDYGHWIINLGHRVPITSPSHQGVQEESWFFVAQTEAEADAVIAGLDIRYVMVDQAMVTGKWYAIVQKAQLSLEDIQELWPEAMVTKLWQERADGWGLVYSNGEVKIFERAAVKYMSFEFVKRYLDISPGTYGHAQGVYTDGQYIWYASGDMLKRTYLDSPDWSSPLAVNEYANTDGADVDQINGIALYGDYLYAAAPIFVNNSPRCFVKWYDKNTLEFVGETEILWDGIGSAQEGLSFHDGYWWVCYYDRKAVSRYDTDWNFVDSIPIQSDNVQGIRWTGDELWVVLSWGTDMPGHVQRYSWNGVDLEYLGVLARPPQLMYQQGLCKEPNTNYVWFAEFFVSADGVTHNNLVKTRLME